MNLWRVWGEKAGPQVQDCKRNVLEQRIGHFYIKMSKLGVFNCRIFGTKINEFCVLEEQCSKCQYSYAAWRPITLIFLVKNLTSGIFNKQMTVRQNT